MTIFRTISIFRSPLLLHGVSRAIFLLSMFFAIIAAIDKIFSIFELPLIVEQLAPGRMATQENYVRYLNSDTTVDTVFIGSSLANIGIDPKIVYEASGTRSYNAGRLGYAPVNLSHEVAIEVIETKRPKRIVYAIDSWSLQTVPREREYIDRQWTSNHMLRFMSSFLYREVFFFWTEKVFHGELIPPWEAWTVQMREGGRFYTYDGHMVHENGWMEIFGVGNPKYVTPIGDFTVRDDQLFYLDKLVASCAVTGTELVFIHMPEYEEMYRQKPKRYIPFRKFINEYTEEHDIRFMDFGFLHMFPIDNSSLFFDSHHLNSRGAKLFSGILGSALINDKSN